MPLWHAACPLSDLQRLSGMRAGLLAGSKTAPGAAPASGTLPLPAPVPGVSPSTAPVLVRVQAPAPAAVAACPPAGLAPPAPTPALVQAPLPVAAAAACESVAASPPVPTFELAPVLAAAGVQPTHPAAVVVNRGAPQEPGKSGAQRPGHLPVVCLGYLLLPLLLLLALLPRCLCRPSTSEAPHGAGASQESGSAEAQDSDGH